MASPHHVQSWKARPSCPSSSSSATLGAFPLGKSSSSSHVRNGSGRQRSRFRRRAQQQQQQQQHSRNSSSLASSSSSSYQPHHPNNQQNHSSSSSSQSDESSGGSSFQERDFEAEAQRKFYQLQQKRKQEAEERARAFAEAKAGLHPEYDQTLKTVERHVDDSITQKPAHPIQEEMMTNQGRHPTSNTQLTKTARTIKQMAQEDRQIDWQYVKGHEGDDGNEKADINAKRGAKGNTNASIRTI